MNAKLHFPNSVEPFERLGEWSTKPRPQFAYKSTQVIDYLHCMWGKHGWVLKLCVYGSLSDTGPSNTNLVIKGSAPAAWRVWFDSLVCFFMFLLPIVSTWLFVDFVSIRCPPQTLAWGHCDVVEKIWFEIMGVSWQTLVCGGVWCYEGLWSMVQIYIIVYIYINIYVNFIYHAVDGVGVFVINVSVALKKRHCVTYVF